MVLREIVALIAARLALGVPLCLLAARWIKSFLFGVSGGDPASIGAALFLIVLLASLAAWFPARHAARIDPMSALKYE